MAKKKIKQVILCLDTSATYARDITRGIAKYASLAGPWIFYREPDLLSKPLTELRKIQADGVIASALDSRIAHKALELSLPLVMAVENVEEPDFKRLSTISASDFEIGQMAATHLLQIGLKRFGFYGVKNTYWSDQRLKGFQDYLQSYGFEVNALYHPLKSRGKTRYDDVLEISNWLRSIQKPLGILTCNDDYGQYVLQACKVMQANVPEEVAVIGVDNDDLICDLTDPPLSSIALSSKQTGYEAAKQLDLLMNKRKTKEKHIYIRPTHVVTRQSTDIITVDDKQVANAIQYIRKHSNELIQVDDVCQEVSVSRRQLERKFRKALKRSINHEIRLHRAEQVAKMLLQTNMTISQIADELDFNGLHHMGRLFKSVKGVTPFDYRQKHISL